MNRRHVLLCVASAASVVPLAGCLDFGRSDPGDSDSDGDSSAGTGSDSSDSTPEWYDDPATAPTSGLPDPPFAEMRAEPVGVHLVGGPRPEATAGVDVVQVWNDTEIAQRLTVVVTGDTRGPLFDEVVDITAGNHVDFYFQWPDTYTVTVDGSESSLQTTFVRDDVDCTVSVTTLRVYDGGTGLRTASQPGDCGTETTAADS